MPTAPVTSARPLTASGRPCAWRTRRGTTRSSNGSRSSSRSKTVTGRVRPKAKVEDVDVLTLETRSTRTSRNSPPKGPAEPSTPSGEDG